MTTEQSPVEAIFFAALEKGTPAERVAYLDAACGDDNNLRQRVDRLLAAHPQVGSFLEPPAREEIGAAEAPTIAPRENSPAGLGQTEAAPYESPEEDVGAVIAGKYKLLETLGQGGMGAVFMAQQTQPVKRLVALKLIKLGMDSRQVLARFEAERQALALMDHPNIAKVLDAGTTDSGRPFFVMELVKGVPITRFCDERQLSPRQRLELFIPVCQAIQHAHQKGIIHRDIKPTNVLVALYDDRAVPKVIDFGVAKAAGLQLTDASLMTGFGSVVGTPEYMSPEQAQLNQLDIDTRSDVYALGVLLYELLTGTTPIDRKRLGQGALFEVLRIIREEEPLRPSTRLSTSDALASIAATRKTEPAKLTKLMRGELDWIVMKCLEKDRSRRYETANGLAHDIERYLHDEVVEAQPPTASYRLRKFASKHRAALTTAATIVLLLAAGVLVSSWQAVQAARSRDRAIQAEREANRQRIASDEAKQEALNAERKALDAKAEADRQRDQVSLTAYASGMQLAQRAWEENDVVRARELLEEVPKEAAGRKLRGFEWYYLSRLCHSELRTLKGHAARLIHSVAFSPDGQRLASASYDETVRIWDCATGEELLSLMGHAGPVTSVAFSPDGQRLASGSFDNTVRIWDSATGKEVFSLKANADGVWRVTFSPDGQYLASGSGDKMIKIWDSATGKELSSLKGNEIVRRNDNTGTSFAFSPDGQYLASGSGDKMVKVWESATGKEVSSFKGHDNQVTSVAFSPDGQRLASGSDDQTVRIWDRATGKQLFVLKDHFPIMEVFGFSADGRRLASWSRSGLGSLSPTDTEGYGDTVRIWDSSTGKELFAHKVPYGSLLGFAFTPDGQRLASRDGNKTVKIWDIGSGGSGKPISLKGHAAQVWSVAFSPDGERLASGSTNGTVKLWDITTDKEVFSLGSPPGYGESWQSIGDQRVPFESYNKVVKIWDRVSGKELDFLKYHAHRVTSLASSPDGQRLASASMDGTVKIWDNATDNELFSLKGHSGPVSSVTFSRDGKRLASASMDSTVKIWDSATGKVQFTLNGHAGPVYDVAFSPDSRYLASGSYDRTVKIWDSTIGKALFSLKGHVGTVTRVAFSPDGQRLASGSDDNTVKIWDSATGKELFSLKGHLDFVQSLAFSPDGQRLASGSWDRTVKIWGTSTGRELLSLKVDARVTSVEFSPDGEHLASTGADLGSTFLWDASIIPELQQRRAVNQLVTGLFFQMGLRGEVLKRLRTMPGLSPSRRQEALDAARRCPENPWLLNALARELVKQPGGEMSGYRKALRFSEGACRLEPKNGLSLNTLGVAYYRAGNYEKALATLLRSDQINKAQFQGSIPADLAFLAMTQQQRGHAKEAQAELQRLWGRMNDPRLRERMKDPGFGWAHDDEAQGFLREAEALLAKPKTPGGK
jgi:WD40 repeat protein/serine/threonine protein kinase